MTRGFGVRIFDVRSSVQGLEICTGLGHESRYADEIVLLSKLHNICFSLEAEVELHGGSGCDSPQSGLPRRKRNEGAGLQPTKGSRCKIRRMHGRSQIAVLKATKDPASRQSE